MNLGGLWLGLECANKLRQERLPESVDRGMMLLPSFLFSLPFVPTSAESEIITRSSLRFIIRRDTTNTLISFVYRRYGITHYMFLLSTVNQLRDIPLS